MRRARVQAGITGNSLLKHDRWLWLAPLLLLTAWLAARKLNADAIWHDEYWSLFNAGGAQYGPLTLAQTWERISLYDTPQAPGYYLLLNGWGKLVGWTPFAERALSLLFGLLAIAWIYRLGRDAASSRVGLYAAAALGTSAFFVHYLHEMRVYTVYVLATIITIWAYWGIICAKREPGRVVQLAFFGGVLASLYLHYLMGLTLAALAFYHLLFVPKNRRWWRVPILMVAAGVMFLPWLPTFRSGLGIKTTNIGSGSFGQILRNLAFALSNGSLILLTLVSVFALRRTGRGARMIWFIGLLVLAAGLLLNVRVLLSDTRYFMALWAFFPLVAGFGLAQLAKTRLKPEIVLGVWMLTGVTASLNPDFIADTIGVGLFDSVFPWNVAASELTAYTQPGDLVTFTLPDGLSTWLQWEAAGHYMGDMGTNRGVRFWIVAHDTGYREALELEDEPFERVWAAYMQPKPTLLAELEGVLDREYIRCGTVVNGSTVYLELYASCEVCCPPEDAERETLYRFGDGILITGVEPLPEQATESLDVRLGWVVPDAVPRYTYSVALHVMDDAGDLVTQTDYGLPEQRFSCSPVTIALNDVPPGAYRLMVVVYAWESGQRLVGTDVRTNETGDSLLLGTFRVS